MTPAGRMAVAARIARAHAHTRVSLCTTGRLASRKGIPKLLEIGLEIGMEQARAAHAGFHVAHHALLDRDVHFLLLHLPVGDGADPAPGALALGLKPAPAVQERA